MYLFRLKCNVFSLITDSLIYLLRVILQLRDCCKAWQFTLERWMLLLLICQKKHCHCTQKHWKLTQNFFLEIQLWIHCRNLHLSLLQATCLNWNPNYTDSSSMAPNYLVRISSQYLEELLYPPVYWTVRERNASSSSGCLWVQMINNRFHY